MKRCHITLLAPVAALALAAPLSACGSDDASSDATTGSSGSSTMVTGTITDTTPAGTTAAQMSGEAAVGVLTVSGAWVRQPAAGQTTSAAYATITNDGETDITLVAASVPFGATVEIHETIANDDGTMAMQEVPEGFVVPAGGSFALEPGGPHIMMFDIDPADLAGTIEVTMVFDAADGSQIEVTVPAPVRPLDMGGDSGLGMTGTTMAD